MHRRVLLTISVLVIALTGCRNEPDYATESFFPRSLDVEVDVSGVHFVHVAGFADGTLRIYRVNDADLELQRVFWAGFGSDPTIGHTGAALIDSPLFAGAWDVVLTADGTSAVVSGRLSHRVVRLHKDAGTWVIRSSLVDGQTTPLEIPVEGGGTEILANLNIQGLDRPRGLALSPNERSVYVSGYGDNAVALLGLEDERLTYEGALQDLPAPRQIVALDPSATATTTATTSTSASGDVLYVLGGNADTCDADDTQIITLARSELGPRLLQGISSSLDAFTCETDEDPLDCLQDDLALPGLVGGFGLAHTVTSSGTEYMLVSSKCQGTVTALVRRADDLLDYAGVYRIVAPWEPATVTATVASAAGLRNIEVHDGIVYAAAAEGGFIAHFPLECVTAFDSLADPTVCAGVVCVDEASGCAQAPTDVNAVSAHPWGLRAKGAVLYATYDVEGQVAVFDLAEDGTPTLRFSQ